MSNKLAMKVQIAICPSSGFCFGVKRAVDITEKMLSEHPGEKIFTLGPIVHNKKVVGNLESKGILSRESADDMDSGIMIVRSHGVAPDIIEKAKKKGLSVTDATCPFVKKIHNIVKKLHVKGIPIIILGSERHPEIQGIKGYAGAECFTANSLSDIEKLPTLNKAGIVVQTTKIKEEFYTLAAELIKRIPECHIYNTICRETLRRQKNTAELAFSSDIMIIAGSKNSSNTSKLYSISSNLCSCAYWVENASEVKQEWFKGKLSIGLACGASTPIEELDEIKEKIKSYCSDIIIQA